jgi:hypothetical protein
MNDPQTLIEAVRYFSDLHRCEQYMRELRWPGGNPVCEHCGSEPAIRMVPSIGAPLPTCAKCGIVYMD